MKQVEDLLGKCELISDTDDMRKFRNFQTSIKTAETRLPGNGAQNAGARNRAGGSLL